MRKFVETNIEFQNKKFNLSEVFKCYENIEKEAKEYLDNISFHNIPKVSNIYYKTLGIKLNDFSELIKACLSIKLLTSNLNSSII